MHLGQVIRINELTNPARSMAAAIESFLSYCQSKNLSPNTSQYYRYRLEAFQRYLDAEAPGVTPETISTKTIRSFITDELQKNSASTANHSVIALRVFFNYLVGDEYLASNPMTGVQKVKSGRRLVNTFSMDQVETLLSGCQRNFVGARDRAIIMVLFDCGLRVSELCGLTLDNTSLAEQTLLVVGKGDRDRLVSFGGATRQALMRYLDRRGQLDTGHVFVTSLAEPLTRFRAAKIIRARCAKANITGVRCSPHTLRHSFAVSYLRSGGDVFSLQKLLGHSDLTMTRHYCQLSDTDALSRHRLYSPGDRLQQATEAVGHRKRLR